MATYRVPLLYHLTIHVLYRPVPQNLLYLPWGSWHWRAWSLEAGWWACFISNKRIDTHLASSPLTGVEVRSRLLDSPAAGHTTPSASWSTSSVSPPLSPPTSPPARPEPPICHHRWCHRTRRPRCRASPHASCQTLFIPSCPKGT